MKRVLLLGLLVLSNLIQSMDDKPTLQPSMEFQNPAPRPSWLNFRINWNNLQPPGVKQPAPPALKDSTNRDAQQIRVFFLELYKKNSAHAYDLLFDVFDKIHNLCIVQLAELDDPDSEKLKHYVYSLVTTLYDEKEHAFIELRKSRIDSRVNEKGKKVSELYVNFMKSFYPETAQEQIDQLIKENAPWVAEALKSYTQGYRQRETSLPEISKQLQSDIYKNHEMLKSIVRYIREHKFEKAREYIKEKGLGKRYPYQSYVIGGLQNQYAEKWLDNLGVKCPSAACLKFVKELIELDNAKANSKSMTLEEYWEQKKEFLNKAIEELYSTHPDRSMQLLYDALFDQNSIYKEFSQKSKEILQKDIPFQIIDVATAEQRKLLNQLVLLDEPNLAWHAIKQVIASIDNQELAPGYLSIAQEMHDAIKYRRTRSILAIEDVATVARNRTQGLIYKELVPLVATLTRVLNKKTNSKIDQGQYRTLEVILSDCITTLKEAQKNNFAEAKSIFDHKVFPALQGFPSFGKQLPKLDIPAIKLMPFDHQAATLSSEYKQRRSERCKIQDSQQKQGKKLVLDDKALAMLQAYEIDTCKYAMRYDKPIVQHAANEAIDIFNQTAELKACHVIPLEFLDLTITVTDQGFDHVRSDNLKGFDYIEFGHSACAYGHAVLKGFGFGIWDASKGMIIDHPMHTAMLVVAPEGYFAYQLGKLTWNLAGTGLQYLVNPEKGKQQFHDYIKPIKDIISALTDRESQLSGPEKVTTVVRIGTTIAAECYLTSKVKQAYQKLLTDPRVQNLGKNVVEQLESKFAGASRAIQKCNNIYEFFKTNFGQHVKNCAIKLKQRYYFKDGRSEAIYQATKDINEHIKKGDYFYLDKLHLDHLEVFGKNKVCKAVVNLDGSLNTKKTMAVMGKRKIQFK